MSSEKKTRKKSAKEPAVPEQAAAQEEPVEEKEELLEGVEPAGAWQAKDVTDNDRLMAALAYGSQVVVPVLVPAVMLLAEESKERAFQKYHAIQSLGFLVAAIVYQVLAAIVYCGLAAATGGCLACVLWVVFLVPVAPALYYAYQAYQGYYFKIPFLTDFLVNSKWLEMPPASD